MVGGTIEKLSTFIAQDWQEDITDDGAEQSIKSLGKSCPLSTPIRHFSQLRSVN